MEAEQWFQFIYGVKAKVKLTETEMSWYEEGNDQPTIHARIPALEKQLGHHARVYKGKKDFSIDVLLTVPSEKGENTFYLDIFVNKDFRRPYEVIHVRAFQLSRMGIPLYEGTALDEIKDMIYDYIVSQPEIRLKEATGLVRRKAK